MLRYLYLWIGIGWTMVLAVCYLSLTPSPPDLNIKFEHIDKLEHFVAYFVLMAWFAQIYKAKRSRTYYVLFFIVMGILIEIFQGLGQVRMFEYSDMLANTSGVAVAWFITKGHLKHALLLFENVILT